MINSKEIKDLNSGVRNNFIGFINDTISAGYTNRINSTLRDNEFQDKLYRQGRDFPGNIVTNARGGESYHNYGYAADIEFFKNGQPVKDFRELVAIGKKYGLTWGGTFKSIYDTPHWQKTSIEVQKEISKKKTVNNSIFNASSIILIGAVILFFFMKGK